MGFIQVNILKNLSKHFNKPIEYLTIERFPKMSRH
jgi:hypothetical protein